MLAQWNRLCLHTAIGLTLLALLFPPFGMFGGYDEYGFILSGPPSFNAAASQANAMFGANASRLAGDVHFSIDFARMFVELALIWGIYILLKRTVLKPTAV